MTRLPSPLAALPFAVCLAPPDAKAGGGGPAQIAEIVTFRILPGTDPARFLAAAKATGPIVTAQPGFLRRTLSQDDSGLWTDHVEWADAGSAEAAAEVVMREPAFGAFAEMIVPEGMSMRHAQILWRMDD